jgi:hypothetical protein
MNLKDKKKKIFSLIAALRLLAGDNSGINYLSNLGLDKLNPKNGMPKLKVSASFSSISNGTDPIQFLLDLVKSLVGFEALLEGFVTSMTYSMPSIIDEILKLIQNELKGLVSCGVDPSIPNFLMNPGIVIEVSKIDSLDLFKIDPSSTAGQLLYQDITSPLTNSNDLNTFLYGVIQDDGVTHSWKGILDITFNSIGIPNVRPNNSLTIKVPTAYGINTLTDLNKDFLANLSTPSAPLLDSKKMINDVVDSVYGTVSAAAKKTLKQLQQQAEIDNVVECLSNTDSGDEIDDNYFTFTNEEVYVHEETAALKQKGIVKLECCNKIQSSIPITSLTSFNDEMNQATLIEDKKTIISNNLNKMATESAANSKNPSDEISIKLNFIESLIKSLTKAIVGNFLSPKLIIIFLINFKIAFGADAIFDDAIDFLKKNKNLIHAIVKKVTEMMIKVLLNIALKKVAQLVADSEITKEKEKAKNKLNQILSLVGVDVNIAKMLKINVSVQ